MLASGFCGGLGLGGWLVMVGFWVGFILLVVWAVSRLFPSGDRSYDDEELLDRRLATGDIDPDTYRELRTQLVGAGPR